MMKEKKEFPKEEFLSFRCVLESVLRLGVFFSPWLDSLFITVGMNLDLTFFL